MIFILNYMDYKRNLFYGAPVVIHLRARLLRNRMSKPEQIMWDELRNRNFLGYKFRRQHPAGYFIIDFYCHELKLAIEIDGYNHSHGIQRSVDEYRDKQLDEFGIMTIRFSNEDVCNKLDVVLSQLNCIINIRRSQLSN
ncbi:MAG: endonuclease domain-containing protein [Bacteroidia bacterium]|nr:endonuclease domain-containing protein [Bacteroidia bacterium]